MHHVQGCAPFGVAVRLRQVSLNTQTVPLRWVPRTDGGPSLIPQGRCRENGRPDRFLTSSTDEALHRTRVGVFL